MARRSRPAGTRWGRRLLYGLGVVGLVAAAVVAYLTVLGDRTSPVGVDEAVDRFEAEQTDSPTASTEPSEAPRPAEGVYVYATEGRETIDLLGGATHDYPAETTVAVTHTECGIGQRWLPLDERWDHEELCLTDEGRERQILRTHHEFFGIDDDEDFTCEPGYVQHPARPRAGATWTTVCESDGSRLEGTGTVVGIETRTVAGQSVRTVHVRITEEATGANTGPSRDDYWWRLGDGLLVARASTVESRSDTPLGVATYTERFTLELVSLDPRT